MGKAEQTSLVHKTTIYSVGKEIGYRVVGCLVAQLCPTLCDPVDCSMPGFSALYYFPEFVQTHVH